MLLALSKISFSPSWKNLKISAASVAEETFDFFSQNQNIARLFRQEISDKKFYSDEISSHFINTIKL